MPLAKDRLTNGLTLVGSYKKKDYNLHVTEDGEGKFTFTVDGIKDGKKDKVFTSLSTAGREIMNGVACNGWRFWGVEGETPEPVAKSEKGAAKTSTATKAKAKAPTKPKKAEQIKLARQQKDAPEGNARWFCDSCMKSFFVPNGETPDKCPEGHPRMIVDEFAASPTTESEPAAKAKAPAKPRATKAKAEPEATTESTDDDADTTEDGGEAESNEGGTDDQTDDLFGD